MADERCQGVHGSRTDMFNCVGCVKYVVRNATVSHRKEIQAQCLCVYIEGSRGKSVVTWLEVDTNF